MHKRALSLLVLSVLLFAGCNGNNETRDPAFNENWENDVDAREPGLIEAGQPLSVTAERREAARMAFASLDKAQLDIDFSPDDLYATFNEFALTHFGMANQPLLARHTAEQLAFVPSGEWQHRSLHSAAMAFETTQPVRGYIAYGRRPGQLEYQTKETDRYYFNQLHHLTDLEPDTTYQYQFVARRANGDTLRSTVREFTTLTTKGLTLVEGASLEAPLRLNKPNTTYVLTGDLVASGTAVHLDAPGITLDLNGHRIVYANDLQQSISQRSLDRAASGIWSGRQGLKGLRIVNGTLEEGHVGNKADSGEFGLHAVYLQQPRDTELAGLAVRYQGAQVYALHLQHPTGSLHIHHNDLTDRGYEILDRHGAGGGRPLRITSRADAPPNDFELNHNVVRRTRHMGLEQARLIHHNEIYVDSWATNSFAIQPPSRQGEAIRNRLFLTGYNAIGFGWANRDLLVAENLVQMEGLATGDRRYSESWGERDTTSAMRITNYGSGGQVRHNSRYRDNVILGRARGGSVMRGTMFFSDESITETHFKNNYVHLLAEDEQTREVTPIVAQGVSTTQEKHQPSYYQDNHLISNVANLRFGDSYGRGNRHVVKNPVIERVGNHPDYHTIVFGGGWQSYDHQLIDPVFKGGARYDDVWWQHTSVLSAFDLLWTLTLEGEPGAAVSIEDVNGEPVFSGRLDSEGMRAVSLKAQTVRPAQWYPGIEMAGVQTGFESQSIPHTPHRVTVGEQTRKVELMAPTRLVF